MEEEKRATDRFRQQIKEVERKIIEANECVKFMRKNIKFSYQLVNVLPDIFRLDSALSDSFQASAASSVNEKEIVIKVQNFDKGSIFEWT
jgi:hypothetical protein